MILCKNFIVNPFNPRQDHMLYTWIKMIPNLDLKTTPTNPVFLDLKKLGYLLFLVLPTVTSLTASIISHTYCFEFPPAISMSDLQTGGTSDFELF